MSGRPKLEPGTHGTINCYALENGEFKAETRYRPKSGGKTRKITARGRTKGAAKTNVRNRVQEENDAASSTGIINRYTTIENLVEYWYQRLELSQLKDSSKRIYRKTLDRDVIPRIGYLRLHEFTPEQADRWLETLLKESISRAHRSKVPLSLALAIAERYEAVHYNVLKRTTKLPPIPRKKPKALTLEEVELVREAMREPHRLDNPKRKNPDLRLLAMFEIMISNGARIGEVLALTRADVHLEFEKPLIVISKTLSRNMEDKFVVSDTPKTSSSNRLGPLSNKAVEVLRMHLQEMDDIRPEALLFQNEVGEIWGPDAARSRMKRALSLAELEDLKVTPHLYRRTVATHVGRKFGIMAASILIGHSSVLTTERAYFEKSSAAEIDVNAAMTAEPAPLVIEVGQIKPSSDSPVFTFPNKRP